MASDTEPMEKIANILALLLIKDMNKSAGANVLATSGFSNAQIAGLLGTSEGSVRSLISQGKKKVEKPVKSADG